MNKQNFFKIGFFAVLGLLLILSAFFFFKSSPQSPSPAPITITSPLPENQTENLVLVTRIIDGDTIEIEGGTRVRYIGVDTPERGDCFGSESTNANSKLVLNKRIKLETDVQKLDRYGRTLGYVYVDSIFVNEELVAQGFAKVATFPPNVKYVDKFIAAQKTAQEKSLGLWDKNTCVEKLKAETFQNNVLPAQTTNECLIKGNINASGEKIYHMPGQNFYEKTKIEEDNGERWFCSEEEAQSNGWRKSKT